MIRDIIKNQARLTELCEQYEVLRLGLFGSAARGDFDPAKSDLDFLVLFDRRDNPDYVNRYFGLANELETLLGRSVDLVTEASVKTERFRNAIEKDLVTIFERPGHASAA